VAAGKTASNKDKGQEGREDVCVKKKKVNMAGLSHTPSSEWGTNKKEGTHFNWEMRRPFHVRRTAAHWSTTSNTSMIFRLHLTSTH